MKECFGGQGGITAYIGDEPEDCYDCDPETFERCHKVTMAIHLQKISRNLELVIDNGLETGKLKTFVELSEMRRRKEAQQD